MCAEVLVSSDLGHASLISNTPGNDYQATGAAGIESPYCL